MLWLLQRWHWLETSVLLLWLYHEKNHSFTDLIEINQLFSITATPTLRAFTAFIGDLFQTTFFCRRDTIDPTQSHPLKDVDGHRVVPQSVSVERKIRYRLRFPLKSDQWSNLSLTPFGHVLLPPLGLQLRLHNQACQGIDQSN